MGDEVFLDAFSPRIAMLDADRFRLLGTYRTPRCRVGQWVRCRVREP